MTRERRWSEGETPIGAWLRHQQEIESHSAGLGISDIDLILHKYRMPINGMRSRDLQLQMFLEVKCGNAEPLPSQHDSLWMIHQRIWHPGLDTRVHSRLHGPTTLWHFGFYVLSLPGRCPQDSYIYRWGRFAANGAIDWVEIPSHDVVKIFGFRVRPDTLQPLA